jgi:SAM-dependent methyltransferase
MITMDPIGQAIHNYYFDNDKEFLDVDSNYTENEEIDPARFFRKFNEMPDLEKTALNLCQGRVLDVGAGAGSHALELQARGFLVTALDKSELAVGVMLHRGVSNVIHEDICRFKSDNFDSILLLMNGAGIAGTIQGLKELISHLKSLLAQGGQILLDSTDISYLFEEEDGSVWVDLASGDYYGEMTYTVTYKKNITATFPWLFIDFETLSDIAAACGFSCELVGEGADNDFLARLSSFI